MNNTWSSTTSKTTVQNKNYGDGWENTFGKGGKMDQIELARLNQLERCVPAIWEYKDVLYIGAGEYRHHFFTSLYKRCCIVDVVEIEESNCDWLMEQKWIDSVICDDIREFLKTDLEHKWNSIIWSHGVETIPKSAGPGVIKKLEKLVKNGVIVHMVPNGLLGGTGNISVWHEDDFKKLGYETSTLGNVGERNNNLLAYKYIK